MRYYSDILKKFFDTEEALLSEEETARQEKEKAKETKAKLAKAVEDADKDVAKAYEMLEEAKKKVQDLQKEYDAKVDELMNPAKDAVKAAHKARSEAIRNFNEKYGAYTTVYTGSRAEQEFIKFSDSFDKLFKLPFQIWF